MVDAARSEFNAADDYLFANTSDAETAVSGNAIDFTSNGFKCRGTFAGTNASGGTYVYAAFAEYPFRSARAR